MVWPAGQVAQSLGGEGAGYVTIISGFNCLGRMLAGWCSDQFRNWFYRPYFVSVALTLLALSSLIFALFPSLTGLYAGCVVAGLGYGALFSLVPTICPELFGYTNMGSNFMLFQCAPAFSGLLYSAGMAAYVYGQHINAPGNVCLGEECFQLTHWICCVTCVLGVGSALGLGHRTRAFYAQKNVLLNQTLNSKEAPSEYDPDFESSSAKFESI